MIITPLGHTEFLIDIENNSGGNVRILVDAWYSDYAIGDLMERTSQFRLDQDMIPSIDALYISHAHCDHFDPYTLAQIYTPGKSSYPILILPETLRYLEYLIVKYIPLAQIKWLSNHEVYILKGIEISGVMFEQENITNEDDVMMLLVASDRECLFAEIDTLPDDSEEVQKKFNRLFSKKKYETVLYLASRNELEGNLKMLDSQNEKDMEAFKKSYLRERREEIEWGYVKWETEEYENRANFMKIPGFCRGFIGQGICYPRILSEKLAGISAFSLSEVVDREISFATEYGYGFSQKALLPGRQYTINHGVIEQGRKECSIGIFVPYISPGIGQNNIRIYASGPLFPRELNEKELQDGKMRILDILNHRFLPYWSASPVASLRSALIKNREGKYRIGCKYQDETIIFEYSFASSEFVEVAYESLLHIDEVYWLLDILDFLDGKQELYSNFWHKLEPNMIYRLWTCLGANFCNNDLLLKKYTLHFEQALSGKTCNEYFEAVRNTLTKECI
ncbi:MBL fold metallo-hydrolase [Candidatus Gracilibacteria bacterium]|nr:MBL fold metallo-hydrolase [Candidatus Gracilibacteria bacterium]